MRRCLLATSFLFVLGWCGPAAMTQQPLPPTDPTDPADPTDPVEPQGPPPPPRADRDAVAAAGSLAGLDFSADELDLMLADVAANLASYEALRARPLDNSVPPALAFTPLQAGIEVEPWLPPDTPLVLPDAVRPDDLEQLAFADIPTLAALIRAREVSCVELTTMFLARLRRLDETLHCVITYTDERALAQAAERDAELAAGQWRGPLHGIPWGAKDLLATKGYRTTWGAKPFEDQVLDVDATVVQRLDEAGAVLIAKLTLGALAWGDVWFGETTRNPWDPSRGSSGSSAGPASAVVAGGVVFAIGSETLGSIISPSEICGASSLRPTFGRVSRHGAMALSWSMDKLGPLCRSAGDAALVFAALHGPDGHDLTVVDQPYRVPGPTDVSGWKVGVLEAPFEGQPHLQPVLVDLMELGVELVPVRLPDYPVEAMLITLTAEAATAFDDLTRDGRDDALVRQVNQAWPNVFRVARLIPAVEYLRANRLRTRLCQDMDTLMQDVVAIVHPSFGSSALELANLTGHPAAIMPAGFRGDGTPYGVTFTGRLFDEARLLALAQAWQDRNAYHRRHPDVPLTGDTR